MQDTKHESNDDEFNDSVCINKKTSKAFNYRCANHVYYGFDRNWKTSIIWKYSKTYSIASVSNNLSKNPGLLELFFIIYITNFRKYLLMK